MVVLRQSSVEPRQFLMNSPFKTFEKKAAIIAVNFRFRQKHFWNSNGDNVHVKELDFQSELRASIYRLPIISADFMEDQSTIEATTHTFSYGYNLFNSIAAIRLMFPAKVWR